MNNVLLLQKRKKPVSMANREDNENKTFVFLTVLRILSMNGGTQELLGLFYFKRGEK
jgi:hypothetical protein